MHYRERGGERERERERWEMTNNHIVQYEATRFGNACMVWLCGRVLNGIYSLMELVSIHQFEDHPKQYNSSVSIPIPNFVPHYLHLNGVSLLFKRLDNESKEIKKYTKLT